LSILPTLLGLEQRRALVPYRSSVVRRMRGGGRYLWLTQDTHKWCCPVDSHPDLRMTDEAIAQIGAQFNAFVLGDFMEDGTDMTWLCPHDRHIWEIRSYLNKPFLRVFGFFVLPKVFAAAHYKFRSDLERKCGPKWDAAITKTASIRNQLFGGELLFEADNGGYNDYVCNDV
jgi:hypothetical protein